MGSSGVRYHYTFPSERSAHEYAKAAGLIRYRVAATNYAVPSDDPPEQWCSRRSFDVEEALDA